MYFGTLSIMKNIQLIGLLLVVLGSFLPLVHVPIIGNWNYWKLDHYLAITCWIFSAGVLFGIINNSVNMAKIFAILLILLFGFTLFAVKMQSLEYFSFMPFKSWQEKLAGIVKLRWGWIVEFLGAFIIILAKNNNK
ncbi:ABC-type multidrug transport system permease subunit [Chryseobacterium ginsenosidimutans]|nr:ABC-type multidrug transport system permease subunit [Chryseobacterium ginsenosidimutans]